MLKIVFKPRGACKQGVAGRNKNLRPRRRLVRVVDAHWSDGTPLNLTRLTVYSVWTQALEDLSDAILFRILAQPPEEMSEPEHRLTALLKARAILEAQRRGLIDERFTREE